MEFTWRRTLAAIFIFVSLSDVFDHNMVQAGPIPYSSNLVNGINDESSNGNSRSLSPQLMNTLFTLASANGVLPDVMPAFRTTSILQGKRNPNLLLEEIRQSHIDVPLVAPSSLQGPVVAPVFQKPETPGPSLPQSFQVVSGTYLPPGLSPTMIPSFTISHDVNQMPALPPSPPPPTVLPLQSYSFSQPLQHLMQPQPVPDESYSTITPLLPETNPRIEIDYDLFPTPEGMTEIFDHAIENSINEFQPTIVTDDSAQLPISLQINMPAQNMPAPRVTVITAPPPAPTPTPQTEYLPPYLMYPPPMPPIIMEGSRSKLRNWLPIIMIALLNDGCRSRSGSRSCSCGSYCNCGRSNTPIPYPIPIPTNNPIVSSRPRPPLSRRDT